MSEREVWEVVAERFALYKKMRGVDGYNLAKDLATETLRGLDEAKIKKILAAHGLNADKFIGNDDFWDGIQEELNQNE